MNKENHNYRATYISVEQTLEEYDDTLTESYNKKEQGLIKILQNRAKEIKASITDLKKLTSQQSIQKLIGKKKQQMEGERLKLEKSWRELTEKLKKLQAEDKKLTNENKQSAFDVQNLKQKISQLQEENKLLAENIQKLKERKQTLFLTSSTEKQYVSPYHFNLQPKALRRQASEVQTFQFDKQSKQGMKQVKKIQKVKEIPESMLIEFLSRLEVKQKIYAILQK